PLRLARGEIDGDQLVPVGAGHDLVRPEVIREGDRTRRVVDDGAVLGGEAHAAQLGGVVHGEGEQLGMAVADDADGNGGGAPGDAGGAGAAGVVRHQGLPFDLVVVAQLD